MRTKTRLGFLLPFGFVVFLAMGMTTPAIAQEHCYDLVSSNCTYENIFACRDCMGSHCYNAKEDCLRYDFGGGEHCQGEYDLCMGDGIMRCYDCGREDHGTGVGCQYCSTSPGDNDGSNREKRNDTLVLFALSRLIFDLGLNPSAVCDFVRPPVQTEKITATEH